MSLEQAIQALTAAVEANTALLKGASVTKSVVKEDAPAADRPVKPAKPPKVEEKVKPKSEFTREQMQAALSSLKEANGAPAAKAVIKEFGKVDKMADIADDDIDAVYIAATSALEEEGM